MVKKSSSREKHPHKQKEKKLEIAVVTISDTRNLDNDPSGDYIEKFLERKGHKIWRKIVPDDFERIKETLKNFLDKDIVITTGGTGISPRDVTIEAVGHLFDKELKSFSQIFSLKSFKSIGSRAILSRATAGIIDQTPVFCFPGSLNAVKTGLDIIEDELMHVLFHSKG